VEASFDFYRLILVAYLLFLSYLCAEESVVNLYTAY